MEFNIADLFESLVDAIPERDALISGDLRFSFAALEERSNRLAHALREAGVTPGSHVGLHLYNGHPFVEGMIAAFKLRAVPININYRYVAHELRYLVSNADLVALITQREFLPIVEEAILGVDTLKCVIAVEDESGGESATLPVMDYEEVLSRHSGIRSFPPRSGSDLYIIYTGGTTGMPKGVMWRHEDVFFAGLQGGSPGGDPIETPEQLAENALSENNVIHMLPAAPFIHGAAQWGGWIGMFTGGKMVLLPGRSFDAARIIRLIERESVTTVTLVGDAMARPIVDALEQADPFPDMSSLVCIASAGAILSPSVRDRLQELLPDTLVLNNFGATETGHQGSAYPGAEAGPGGRPTFAMDATNTVLDENMRPVVPGSGVIGRLARSGRIPLGYYKDEKQTQERFVVLDGVRWVLPGDMATVSEEGMITVYGRGAVCINTGGEKVFPEEVEEALKAHPEVFDAIVVGIPDERWGEKVAAVVQPRSRPGPPLAELDGWCRKFVAGYKVPRVLVEVDQIQRQPSGKPDYRWAKSMASGEGDS